MLFAQSGFGTIRATVESSVVFPHSGLGETMPRTGENRAASWTWVKIVHSVAASADSVARTTVRWIVAAIVVGHRLAVDRIRPRLGLVELDGFAAAIVGERLAPALHFLVEFRHPDAKLARRTPPGAARIAAW